MNDSYRMMPVHSTWQSRTRRQRRHRQVAVTALSMLLLGWWGTTTSGSTTISSLLRWSHCVLPQQVHALYVQAAATTRGLSPRDITSMSTTKRATATTKTTTTTTTTQRFVGRSAQSCPICSMKMIRTGDKNDGLDNSDEPSSQYTRYRRLKNVPWSARRPFWLWQAGPTRKKIAAIIPKKLLITSWKSKRKDDQGDSTMTVSSVAETMKGTAMISCTPDSPSTPKQTAFQSKQTAKNAASLHHGNESRKEIAAQKFDDGDHHHHHDEDDDHSTPGTNWVVVRASLELPFSAQVAFDAYSNLPRQPSWSPWLQSVEFVDHDPDDIREMILSYNDSHTSTNGRNNSQQQIQSKWTMRRVLGVQWSWYAVCTRLERPRTIEWKSTSGLRNYGRVDFHETTTTTAAILNGDVTNGKPTTLTTTRMNLTISFVAPRFAVGLFQHEGAIANLVEKRILVRTLQLFRNTVLQQDVLSRRVIENNDNDLIATAMTTSQCNATNISIASERS